MVTEEKILNGFVETFDENTGWIKSRGFYSDGVKYGDWWYFDSSNGFLKERGVYKNGKKNGVWLEYSIKGGRLVKYKVFYHSGLKLIKFKNL